MLQLQSLWLDHNNIHGTLPREWGQQGAFPKLFFMSLDDNQLTGERALSGLETPTLARPCATSSKFHLQSYMLLERLAC